MATSRGASTWRGRIAFGMVSIPIRLYKAARRERIRFRQVYRPAPPSASVEEDEPEAQPEPRSGPRLVQPADPTPVEPESAPVARVHSMPMAAAFDEPYAAPEPLPKNQILKGYELEKDRYVVFEPGEIAALRPRTSAELSISEFVRLDEIDPVYYEVSYYAVPETGAEKPYALLFAALRDSGYAALAGFAMHGREHAAVIRPGRRGLILHTLFYSKEVRAEEEYAADPSLAGSRELQLATTLVNALAAPFEPEKLKSTQEERVRALIESRAASAAPAAETETPAPIAPPPDILEALRKSIAAARKPARSETRTGPAPAQTVRRPRKK